MGSYLRLRGVSFLVSCAFLSSMATAATQTNQHYQDWVKLEADGSTTEIVNLSKAPKDPHKPLGVIIPEGLENQKDINAFMASEKALDAAYERVGGAGRCLPGTEGAFLQQQLQRAKTAAGWGWYCAEPFVFSGLAKIAIGAAGPSIVEAAGSVGGALASYAFRDVMREVPLNFSRGVDYADKTIRLIASDLAKGFVETNFSTIQPYVAQGIKSTPAAVKLAGRGLSWAYSKCFGSAEAEAEKNS